MESIGGRQPASQPASQRNSNDLPTALRARRWPARRLANEPMGASSLSRQISLARARPPGRPGARGPTLSLFSPFIRSGRQIVSRARLLFCATPKGGRAGSHLCGRAFGFQPECTRTSGRPAERIDSWPPPPPRTMAPNLAACRRAWASAPQAEGWPPAGQLFGSLSGDTQADWRGKVHSAGHL